MQEYRARSAARQYAFLVVFIAVDFEEMFEMSVTRMLGQRCAFFRPAGSKLREDIGYLCVGRGDAVPAARLGRQKIDRFISRRSKKKPRKEPWPNRIGRGIARHGGGGVLRSLFGKTDRMLNRDVEQRSNAKDHDDTETFKPPEETAVFIA